MPVKTCSWASSPFACAPPQPLPRGGGEHSPRHHLASGDLVGAGRAPERRVAVRKAAEALDDGVMLLRVAEEVIVAERREHSERAALVGKILAVLERHVEEAALGRLELVVEAAVDGE